MGIGSIIEMATPIAAVVFPVAAAALKLAANGFQKDVKEAVTASKEAAEASQAAYDEYLKADADDNITAAEVAQISEKLGIAVKEIGEAVKEIDDVAQHGAGLWARFRKKNA